MNTREIKLRPFTDVADMRRKFAKVREFLEDGDRVRVSIRLKGREMEHAPTLNLCQTIMDEMLVSCSGVALAHRTPLVREGRTISMTVTPKR